MDGNIILLDRALDGRMLLASSGRTMSGVVLAGRGLSAVLGRAVPVLGVAPVFTSVKLSVMICQLNCRETEPTFSSCRLHTTAKHSIQLSHTELKPSAQQCLKQVEGFTLKSIYHLILLSLSNPSSTYSPSTVIHHWTATGLSLKINDWFFRMHHLIFTINIMIHFINHILVCFLLTQFCMYTSSSPRSTPPSLLHSRPIIPNIPSQKSFPSFPRGGTLGERAFSYSGPAAWNQLPQCLHNISNFATFRKHLKVYLFTRFYQL